MEKKSNKALLQRGWFWSIIAVLALACVLFVVFVFSNDHVNLSNDQFYYRGTSYEKYAGPTWSVAEDQYDTLIAHDRHLNLNVYMSEIFQFRNVALVKSNRLGHNPAAIYCENGFHLTAPSSKNIDSIIVDFTQWQTDFQKFMINDNAKVDQLVDALQRDQEDITDLIEYVCTLYLIHKENPSLYITVEVLKTDTYYYFFNTTDYHSVILNDQEVTILLTAIEESQN